MPIIVSYTKSRLMSAALAISVVSSALFALSTQLPREADRPPLNQDQIARLQPRVRVAFADWWLYQLFPFDRSDEKNTTFDAIAWVDEPAKAAFKKFSRYHDLLKTHEILFLKDHTWEPQNLPNGSTRVTYAGYLVSLTDPSMNSHYVRFDLDIRSAPTGLRVCGWKMTYDPDFQTTLSFLSKCKKHASSMQANRKAYDSIREAHLRQEEGKQQLALSLANEAISLNPDCALAYNFRADIRKDLHNYNQAIKDYDQAIVLKPDFALAFFCRAMLKDKLEDSMGAISDYGETLRLCPNFHYARINRGGILDMEGDRTGALADYDKLADIPEFREVIMAQRAQLKLEMGNLIGAIIDCNESLKLNPKNTNAYRTRGIVWHTLGLQRFAESDFAKARGEGIR